MTTLEEILGDTAAKPLGSIVIASVIASASAAAEELVHSSAGLIEGRGEIAMFSRTVRLFTFAVFSSKPY